MSFFHQSLAKRSIGRVDQETPERNRCQMVPILARIGYA